MDNYVYLFDENNIDVNLLDGKTANIIQMKKKQNTDSPWNFHFKKCS